MFFVFHSINVINLKKTNFLPFFFASNTENECKMVFGEKKSNIFRLLEITFAKMKTILTLYYLIFENVVGYAERLLSLRLPENACQIIIRLIVSVVNLSHKLAGITFVDFH